MAKEPRLRPAHSDRFQPGSLSRTRTNPKEAGPTGLPSHGDDVTRAASLLQEKSQLPAWVLNRPETPTTNTKPNSVESDGFSALVLTIPEVAELLRVSERTVRRMIHGGELAGFKFGRSVRIPRLQIDNLLKF